MDQNGPLQVKMDQDEPFWSILVSRMLNPVRNKVILTKMVVWTIMVQYTFRQYCGHSLISPKVDVISLKVNVKNFDECLTPLVLTPW